MAAPCLRVRRSAESDRSGAEGNRTPGLDSAIVALYQLSYSPEGAECTGGRAAVTRRSALQPLVVPARSLALADRGEQVKEPAERHEREREEIQHDRLFRRRGEEERAD
ncbi:MAG: hypothetical protein RL058_1811 [Actinomycetota bacterium]|jgi:hypothetical protein